MKILYFDLGMGAAGDMLSAALLELFDDRDAVLAELNALGIPHVRYIAEQSRKCGISATHMKVEVDGTEEGEDAHFHATLPSIYRVLNCTNLSSKLKERVYAVYRRIAEAESRVHEEPVSLVHFHEVGALDAIADVAAVCYLIDKLSPDRIAASPVHVGSGSVKCAHGILPVPAPATALLLQGIPTYAGEIAGELCTPTGAALIAEFANEFGPQPTMAILQCGYGCGKKDFARANVVRVFLGDAAGDGDEIAELSCNLDDMTPEEIGFAMEQLLEAGALDVFTTPIGMKKCRPGVMLTVLCRQAAEPELAAAMFRHTTTLGIRRNLCTRYTLQRRFDTVSTPLGNVVKKTSFGFDTQRSKPEFEDLARIARREKISLGEARAIYEKFR